MDSILATRIRDQALLIAIHLLYIFISCLSHIVSTFVQFVQYVWAWMFNVNSAIGNLLWRQSNLIANATNFFGFFVSFHPSIHSSLYVLWIGVEILFISLLRLVQWIWYCKETEKSKIYSGEFVPKLTHFIDAGDWENDNRLEIRFHAQDPRCISNWTEP